LAMITTAIVFACAITPIDLLLSPVLCEAGFTLLEFLFIQRS